MTRDEAVEVVKRKLPPVRPYHAALIDTITTTMGFTHATAVEIADLYEKRRKRGKDRPCQAVVHSGPGHQSESFCKAHGGPRGHDRDDQGRLLHHNEHGEWTDDRPYIDYWG